MPGKFDGKVAFVTGGSSGIGEAAARLLAADGAHVALADVQEELGQQVAESVRAAGGEALFVRCDVAAEGESTPRSTRCWRGATGSTTRSTTLASQLRARRRLAIRRMTGSGSWPST